MDELTTARHILESLGTSQSLAGWHDHVRRLSGSPNSIDVSGLRREIADALSQVLTPQGNCPEIGEIGSEEVQVTAARESIQSLIDRSSRRLRDLISQTPPVVTPSVDLNRDVGITYPPLDLQAELLRLTTALGGPYGTDKFSTFLYSYTRMQVPRVIVELGTGLGASALAMALAVRQNAAGHVWTIDDQEHQPDVVRALDSVGNELNGVVWDGLRVVGSDRILQELANRLMLSSQITYIVSRMHPEVREHFDSYPFGRPVDLLFSDFDHRPTTILQVLAQFLPMMASSSSIFVHSASTQWSSYLLLEQLVDQMNHALVPGVLQSQASVDLTSVVKNRRFTLIHLTEPDRMEQNSAAWLKIEPVDLQPHPATSVRGLAL